MFKKLALVLLVLIILASVLWLFFFKEKSQNNLDNNQLSALELMQQQIENNEDDAQVDNAGVQDVKVEGAVEIPGANLITTEKIVVTELGEAVQTNVMPNAPEAPKAVTIEKKQLSEKMVQIKIANNQFSPNTFTVSPGSPVSLAFLSEDKKTHVITFSDSSLAALAFGISAGKIKAMSFNAPTAPGGYEFKCDIPGHASAGEKGYMIVE